MLWGAYAPKKGEIIDRKKHLVLMSRTPFAILCTTWASSDANISVKRMSI